MKSILNSSSSAALQAALIIISIAALLQVTGCPPQPGREPTTTTTQDEERGREREMQPFPETIRGLNQPVAMAFAPDRRIFLTERIGRIRIFENRRLQDQPFATVDVPNVIGYHETGLLGIALHPDFESQPYVYVYHTYQRGGNLLNRVVRFRADSNGEPEPEIILNNIPGGRLHNGGVIVFGPDDNLYIATGDSGNSDLAQDIDSLAGKVLRVEPNGGIPRENPFRNSPVYSYGHRNIFGMAFRPESGILYVTENGPTEDDEVNRIEPGENYGWPIVTGKVDDERFVDPLVTYTPNIAPTQAIFYTGDVFSEIRGRFVFGAYNTSNVRALDIGGPGGTRVESDEVIYDSNQRVIGIAQSPDGDIYVIGTSVIRRIDRLID